MPFIDGVQLENVVETASGHCGNPANAAIWYHVKSATTKTLDLTTIDSDVATDIELYTGPVGAPVFVQCGVNIDLNLRDKLTFTANANTDYFIRVAREVPPPGDFAIVLKVSLGSPDTMVQASGFATNYGTFYPSSTAIATPSTSAPPAARPPRPRSPSTTRAAPASAS